MRKDFKKEIEWLIREKYGGKADEVAFRAHLKNDFSRLEKGEPVDYVIGWKDFLDCKIDLSERPLIPREETAYWVEELLKNIPKDKGLKVLDIFAGSGCIGLAILKHYPQAKVIFADKEEGCLRQIKKNLKINKLTGQVRQSDIFSNIKDKFDLITANPPYVPTKGQRVDKSVRDWEPGLALYGGVSGLVIAEEFLKQAKFYLKNGGQIYLEFGFGQKKAIEAFLKKFGYKSWQFHKDQFGKFRFVVVE